MTGPAISTTWLGLAKIYEIKNELRMNYMTGRFQSSSEFVSKDFD